MNRHAREMIMRMRDGRNPYGSRVGYVTSREPHRRDRGEYDGSWNCPPYEEMSGDFEYMRQYHDGNRPNNYGMRDYRSGKDGDYGDYGAYVDYGRGMDYRGRRRNSRGQYMSDRGSDYGDDEDMRLSKEEMRKWEKDLDNADGTRGSHFEKEQIDQVARSIGIDPKEFGDGVLCMTTQMFYSDYCIVAKKFGVDRIEFYIEMANAFLKDKDFDGNGAEKLYLYYTFLADNEG